jgi:hypothetical protein
MLEKVDKEVKAENDSSRRNTDGEETKSHTNFNALLAGTLLNIEATFSVLLGLNLCFIYAEKEEMKSIKPS